MRAAARAVAAALAVGLLATGCGRASGSSTTPAAESSRPSELVGLWRVDGAGIRPGTALKLYADARMFLFSDCGAPIGKWRAVPGGAFSAILTFGAPDCPAVEGTDEWERNTPVWLRTVAAFRPDGANRLLTDAVGHTVATLVPTTTAPGEAMPGERVPPDPPTPAESTLLDTGALPPTGLRPATLADLVGNWLPISDKPLPSGVYVEFSANAAVKLRDGCNASHGHVTALPGGAFAAALYLSYIVTCDNSPVADWIVGAGWASMDGPDLVFSAPTGARLGALRRTAGASPAPTG